MTIKQITIEELRLFTGELLSKSYMQLGQRPHEDDIFSFALILAEDLKVDFPNLTIEDIRQSFRQGIRSTPDFHISVKTYYKWIKAHEQLIWNEASKEPERRDKRLKYRSRKGTGLNSISNNIKQIK